LAHAQARDAVHRPLDVNSLVVELNQMNISSITLASAAHDRTTYLHRPDLGRQLNPDSRERLTKLKSNYEAVFVIADGLQFIGLGVPTVSYDYEVTANLREHVHCCINILTIEVSVVCHQLCRMRPCRLQNIDLINPMIDWKIPLLMAGALLDHQAHGLGNIPDAVPHFNIFLLYCQATLISKK